MTILIPVLTKELVTQEIPKSLPFADIGLSGGYGEARSNLVAALNASHFALAQFYYTELFEQSYIEMRDEGDIPDLTKEDFLEYCAKHFPQYFRHI